MELKFENKMYIYSFSINGFDLETLDYIKLNVLCLEKEACSNITAFEMTQIYYIFVFIFEFPLKKHLFKFHNIFFSIQIYKLVY